MQQLSEKELNDLFRADEAIISFLIESTTENNKYWELERYVCDLSEQY